MSAFLLVEDDATVARSLSRLLRATAHVVVAGTVAEGVAALDSGDRTWIGVLADLGLPDGSGLTVVEHARAKGVCFPVLVLTGSTEPQDINRAADAGAIYACKPVDSERIRRFAHTALGVRAKLEARYDAAVRVESSRFRLTAGEEDILRLALDGRSRERMAAERESSAATIKRHVANLLAKTGAPSLDDQVNRMLRVCVSQVSLEA